MESVLHREIFGRVGQWEGGIREPFYIIAPGITKAGSTCAVPVSGIDWYPTLLALVGVPVPAKQDIDGVSIVPLLKGGTIPDRPLFWHCLHYGNQGGEPSSIITQDNWKLIHYYEDSRDELYHLSSDPGEQHDLAASTTARVKTMRAKLDAWLKATDAKFPTKDPEFDAAKSAAYLEMLKTTGDAKLEMSHAEYLDPNFKPNKTCWGAPRRTDPGDDGTSNHDRAQDPLMNRRRFVPAHGSWRSNRRFIPWA